MIIKMRKKLQSKCLIYVQNDKMYYFIIIMFLFRLNCVKYCVFFSVFNFFLITPVVFKNVLYYDISTPEFFRGLHLT